MGLGEGGIGHPVLEGVLEEFLVTEGLYGGGVTKDGPAGIDRMADGVHHVEFFPEDSSEAAAVSVAALFLEVLCRAQQQHLVLYAVIGSERGLGKLLGLEAAYPLFHGDVSGGAGLEGLVEGIEAADAVHIAAAGGNALIHVFYRKAEDAAGEIRQSLGKKCVLVALAFEGLEPAAGGFTVGQQALEGNGVLFRRSQGPDAPGCEVPEETAAAAHFGRSVYIRELGRICVVKDEDRRAACPGDELCKAL